MKFVLLPGQEESLFARSVVPCGKGLCHLSRTSLRRALCRRPAPVREPAPSPSPIILAYHNTVVKKNRGAARRIRKQTCFVGAGLALPEVEKVSGTCEEMDFEKRRVEMAVAQGVRVLGC
jgi:hypothetical protein